MRSAANLLLTQTNDLFAGNRQLIEKMARPERFELPTFWFVDRVASLLAFINQQLAWPALTLPAAKCRGVSPELSAPLRFELIRGLMNLNRSIPRYK